MKELPTFLRVDDRDADGEGGRRTLNVPDDGLLTHTSQEQRRVEDKCQALFEDWNREAHPTYACAVVVACFIAALQGDAAASTGPHAVLDERPALSSRGLCVVGRQPPVAGVLVSPTPHGGPAYFRCFL